MRDKDREEREINVEGRNKFGRLRERERGGEREGWREGEVEMEREIETKRGGRLGY